MARVFQCFFLVMLIGHPVPGAQTPTAPPQKQVEPPEEADPPEEDESLKPRTYVLNPLEAKRNIEVGNFYWNKGNYLGALDRYKDATRYNPSSAEAFLKVGQTEEKLHHSDKAKAALEKAIKLAPDSKFAAEAKKKLASMKS